MRTALCLLLTLLAIPAWAEPVSKYSSTAKKDAKVLKDYSKVPEAGDSFEWLCRGFGGYELLFVGGDERSWINVKYGKRVTDLYAAVVENAPGQFPGKANDMVEWRGIEKNGRFEPYAIIYRINGYIENTGKTRTRLLVFKLSKGRAEYVGYAEGAGEDAKAKHLADKSRE
jgi:hypothetical protein